MNWSDVAKTVGGLAPVLGTLLGGPAGAAIGAVVAGALGVKNDPDSVSQAIQSDPTAAAKIIEIESTQRIRLQELVVAAEKNRLDAESAATVAVNATMQEEAKSEHWMSYSWRPVIGFCVGFNTAASAILVLGVYGSVMLGAKDAAAALPTLPTALGALAAINATVLPILGIASWFRGKAQADPANPAEVKG